MILYFMGKMKAWRLFLVMLYIAILYAQSGSILFPVEKNGLWGYIDKKGNIKIELKFQQAAPFNEGLAAVRIDNQWGFINSSGEFCIEPQFDYCMSFHEGRARVWRDGNPGKTGWTGGQIGFIDQNGKIIVRPQHKHALDYSEGLAAIYVKGKCGFIG